MFGEGRAFREKKKRKNRKSAAFRKGIAFPHSRAAQPLTVTRIGGAPLSPEEEARI
jgi:hypothetical protein